MSTATPFKVSPEMFREQRQRLGRSISESFRRGGHVALLQAGSEVPINSTDCNYLFVQESYFYYLFGCEMPDAFGVVLGDGTGVLFIPRLPAEYATWMGELPTPASVLSTCGVERVHYIDEMGSVLKAKGVNTVELLQGRNTDSGLTVLTAKIPDIAKASFLTHSKSWLFDVLTRQRCYKTELEAAVLQYVCKVSSDAHIKVMQTCKPGMSQHQLEATFLHDVYHNGGCRKVSYTCICATGSHGAVLHYPNNNAPVEDGTMALLDMGGNYKCYAADITCSFPVNGKFTEQQRNIYNGVLDAHDAVLRAMKPGVSWVDMHFLALRTLCRHLIKAEILIGQEDTLMEKRIMQYFQPHGLGHLIGLDVHDVGGYHSDAPPRPTAKDCCKLRTARVLEKGLYITVEPGCYFNHALLTAAFANPSMKMHLNEEKIRNEYWNFGGVRIESDLLVTETGVVNYTVVPRTIEEVEKTMAGSSFSKSIEVYNNVL